MLDPSPHPSGRFDETVRLASACLTEDISPAEMARLNQLLETDPESRGIFVQFMHDSQTLRTWASRTAHAAPAAKVLRSAQAGTVGAAVRRSHRGVWLKDLAHDFTQQPLLLAVLVLGLFSAAVLGWQFSQRNVPVVPAPEIVQYQPPQQAGHDAPRPRIARLTRTIGARWSRKGHSTAARPTSILLEGDRLTLEWGVAEIVFDTGATVILEGPAEFVAGATEAPKREPDAAESEVSNAQLRNSAYLVAGRLVAHVPQRARGFTVHTPTVRLVDLGTEFAVSVRSERGTQASNVPPPQSEIPNLKSEITTTEVQVFEGRVAVRDLPPGRIAVPIPPAAEQAADGSLILISNQALVISDKDQSVKHRAAEPARFVREMPALVQPGPFPLFGTGVGLHRGSADPHWELVTTSDDVEFKPQPAVVIPPYGNYVADARETGQWISDGPKRTRPAGCRWTIRTHFDLTGFDPATAQIEGSFAVDDNLVGLRLNGHPLPLPVGKAEKLWGTQTPLRIERGFIAGANTLEFEIENQIVDHTGAAARPSPMALLVDWKGTALPLVQE
jgi:hypothetical protein